MPGEGRFLEALGEIAILDPFLGCQSAVAGGLGE
jgi:hypothetical protein